MTDGERWTREALAGLRADGYAPGAWWRFLGASHRRAAVTRAARPALTRQARTWMGVGALAAAAGGRGLAGWAITALMLDWHLGMVETEDGRPRALGPADACTLLRAWLVPLVADDPRTLVLAVGLATDGVDGALARAGEPTRLGRDLEGLVDAAFAVAALRGLVRSGRLGRPAAAAEAARLTVGTGYAVAVYFRAAAAPAPGRLRAARRLTPVRAAGLLFAASGRRRLADRLVLAGAAASAVMR